MKRPQVDPAGSRRQRRFALGRPDLKREIAVELEHHLESLARDLQVAGRREEEAWEEARRRFGDRERYARACHQIDLKRLRAERRGEIMRDLVSDVRLALRSFGNSPGFAAGAVLTLALGLGTTTAIFSVVYGVMLKPLPFPEPERLAVLWEENPERGWVEANAAPANFFDWRQRAGSFTDLAAYTDWHARAILTGGGEPEMLSAQLVSGNLLDVLGLAPALGRSFRFAETWKGEEAVVMISHGLWQRRFAGDPAVVGSTLTLSGEPRTVIGVLPEGLGFPYPGIDLWAPFGWDPEVKTAVWFRRAHSLRPVGRLAPGVTFAQAGDELAAIARRLEEEYPETNRLMGAGLTPLSDWVVGDRRRPLEALLAAVGLLLVIACANVANLLLARSTGRAQEMVVRGALGASRLRIVRQLLTESLLLALAGGALGVLAANWGTRLLLAAGPGELPRGGEVGVDWTVLAFALAVTTLAGLLFGLAPAVEAARWQRGAAALRGGPGTTAGRGSEALRSALAAAEVALAVVLLVGAGLLARSFVRLLRVDPGFEAENVLAVDFILPQAHYPEDTAVVELFDRLTAAVRALPGVRAAGLTDRLPLTGLNWTSDFSVAGRGPGEQGVEVHHRTVGPDYFLAAGVPLLRGRFFTREDTAETEPVVLVNETLARRHFPGEDPLGQKLCFDSEPDENSYWRTVVGVVGDERIDGLDRPQRAEIFEPFHQDPQLSTGIVVRTGGDPLALVAALREEVRRLDPDLPLAEVTTLREVVERSTLSRRFTATLIGLFAAAALGLAALGTYGVVAYGVARRRREIGIRMALGAGRGRVVRLVLRRSLAATAAGVAAGLTAAWAAGRLLEGLLFEVRADDPATFAAVPLFLAAVALAATWLPARRAAATEPASTLRQE